MKKHTTISIALLALLCCACEEKQVGGDWDFHDAYILDGENLIEAHGYTVELPAQQCTVDLQIVSSGIYNQQSIDLDHFGMNLPDLFPSRSRRNSKRPRYTTTPSILGESYTKIDRAICKPSA